MLFGNGGSQHLLNRGQTDKRVFPSSASLGHNTFLIEVKPLKLLFSNLEVCDPRHNTFLIEVKPDPQEGVFLVCSGLSQHLLNRGQTSPTEV